MNKEFEYRGYRFNINVKFNTRVEKKIGGKRWHTIITNDMGVSNYYIKNEAEDDFLILFVESAERLAKEWVDKRIDNTQSTDERLIELGFK